MWNKMLIFGWIVWSSKVKLISINLYSYVYYCEFSICSYNHKSKFVWKGISERNRWNSNNIQKHQNFQLINPCNARKPFMLLWANIKWSFRVWFWILKTCFAHIINFVHINDHKPNNLLRPCHSIVANRLYYTWCAFFLFELNDIWLWLPRLRLAMHKIFWFWKLVFSLKTKLWIHWVRLRAWDVYVIYVV